MLKPDVVVSYIDSLIRLVEERCHIREQLDVLEDIGLDTPRAEYLSAKLQVVEYDINKERDDFIAFCTETNNLIRFRRFDPLKDGLGAKDFMYKEVLAEHGLKDKED